MGKSVFYIVFVVVSILAGMPRLAFADNRVGLEQISDSNFVHYGVHEARSKENLADNANIGFIVGEHCVLVIDAGGTHLLGKQLRAAIRRVTDKPVCYVVITHAHPDHFFGASAFIEDNPKFVGHIGLSRQLRARERFYTRQLNDDLGEVAIGSRIVFPDEIIEVGNSLIVSVGTNHDVSIKAWSPAHTDHDLTVFDLKEKVMWTGDILFVDHIPILDSNIKGFISVLAELGNIKVKFYVPGHGAARITWDTAIRRQKRYLTQILVETRQAIKEGMRLMDAVHTIGWKEKKNWVNFENYHRRNVTTAWTELEWE